MNNLTEFARGSESSSKQHKLKVIEQINYYPTTSAKKIRQPELEEELSVTPFETKKPKQTKIISKYLKRSISAVDIELRK